MGLVVVVVVVPLGVASRQCWHRCMGQRWGEYERCCGSYSGVPEPQQMDRDDWKDASCVLTRLSDMEFKRTQGHPQQR